MNYKLSSKSSRSSTCMQHTCNSHQDWSTGHPTAACPRTLVHTWCMLYFLVLIWLFILCFECWFSLFSFIVWLFFMFDIVVFIMWCSCCFFHRTANSTGRNRSIGLVYELQVEWNCVPVAIWGCPRVPGRSWGGRLGRLGGTSGSSALSCIRWES